LENKQHASNFAMAAWFSNFCYGFSAPLDTFGPKVQSLFCNGSVSY